MSPLYLQCCHEAWLALTVVARLPHPDKGQVTAMAGFAVQNWVLPAATYPVPTRYCHKFHPGMKAAALDYPIHYQGVEQLNFPSRPVPEEPGMRTQYPQPAVKAHCIEGKAHY